MRMPGFSARNSTRIGGRYPAAIDGRVGEDDAAVVAAAVRGEAVERAIEPLREVAGEVEQLLAVWGCSATDRVVRVNSVTPSERFELAHRSAHDRLAHVELLGGARERAGRGRRRRTPRGAEDCSCGHIMNQSEIDLGRERRSTRNIDGVTDTVRIGAGAGFADDRIDPAVDLAERGELDFLVFECLAERFDRVAQQLERRRDPGRRVRSRCSPSAWKAVLATCLGKGVTHRDERRRRRPGRRAAAWRE